MSESINGGLTFAATLDIDDFDVSAEAMERRIRNVSNTTVLESTKMDQSIQSFASNGAKYIIGTLVGGGMMSLVNSIVQTRGQFQQLDIAFETMLGSAAKGKMLMDQVTATAAKTPFDLMGVAGGAKQLLAYGTSADKVNDTLVRLGNIASGLSIPLGDMVYLYGTTQTQGRLFTQDVRQFMGRGIPLVKEMATMLGKTEEEINNMVTAGKIGFPDVEKVINKMTDSGGQFFNLMEKQSASLTGMISNLGDAWDTALNKLGADNQEILSSGISGAAYMVEHLDDILQIVKAITIAYGSYKAAIVLNTLVTKGHTGVALIDNTVHQAKVALLKADVALSGESIAIVKKMEEAEKAHIAILQGKITLEQHEQALHKIKVSAINELLTADQKRYLSNKGIAASSKEYTKEAEGILSVEQKMALGKQNLTTSSRSYADTIAVIAGKNADNANSLKKEAEEISKKIPLLNECKRASLEDLNIAKMEVVQANAGTNAKRIALAERNLSIQTKRVESITTEINTASTRKERIERELATLSTKKGTAAGVADIAVKNAQATSTSILSTITAKCTLAMHTLWAAMKANPFGWIITLAGLAYSAFSLFSSKTDETENEVKGLAKAIKEASDSFTEQAGKVDALQKILNNSNNSYEQRNKVLKELKELAPDYNAELTKEGKLINDNTDAIKKYLTQLERQIKLKAAKDELEAAYKEKRTLESTETDQSRKYWDIRQDNSLQGYDRNSATAKISRLFGVESENNAKKALEETQKSLSTVEATISSLNKEISATSTAIDEVNDKQQGFDSENSINKRIKELQEERASVELNSIKYKELSQSIQALQGKLPKTVSNDDSAKKAEQLAEKQKQANLRAEQSRIDVMDEGYAKRKAILDLQHRQSLAAIDKEEKELEKARKEAGKGGLSSKEKQGFSDRRENENTSYNRDHNKLFDGEISYKKSQYELYFRWVENMGADVADKQFASLLKDGNSYKAYVEQQIQQLSGKQAAGTLTEGEGNNLIALKVQYDEITGAKTAMDTFKDSVTQAISRVSTLAEKIQAIADAKERLANGSTGLNPDEKLNVQKDLDNRDVEAQKELQNRLLTEFKTFEEQKKAIQDEYTLLRNAAMAQQNADLLAQVNRGEAEALSALNAQMLMQTDSWNNLFSDLDSLTVDKIDSLITEIQTKMSTADLNLNPADMKAVLDKLDQAKQKILDVNPFKAMGNALKATLGSTEQKAKHSSGNIKTDWNNLAKSTKGCFDFVNDAIDSCEVLSDILGDSGKATMQMVQGIATAGIAMATATSTAEKSSAILAVISAALMAIQWIADLFNNDDELEEKIQNIQGNIDALSNSFDRLENAMNRTYWVYNDEEKEAHEKRINSINQQIDALEQQKKVAAASWNFVEYAKLTKQIKELRYELEKAEQSGDMFQLYDLQQKNLIQQKDLIEQQIAAEKDKKKTDWDKITDWEEQMKDIDTQMKDMELQMLETLAGTDVKSAIDEFADALVDAYCKGEDAAKALGEVTKNVMKKAVVEAIKRQFLAQEINKAVLYLGEAMKDGELDASEKAKFESMVNAAGEATNKALESVGDWIKDIDQETTEDPMTGAVKAMSEETGGIVAGRLNAMVISQSDSNSILRQSLIYHQQTAANTGVSATELKEIKDTLKRIESKDSSLLSQGIS